MQAMRNISARSKFQVCPLYTQLAARREGSKKKLDLLQLV
jgi:hypothetical protein